MSDHSKVGGVA